MTERLIYFSNGAAFVFFLVAAIVLTNLMTIGVWATLYGCIMQYRIPEIIQNYWQQGLPANPEDEKLPDEEGEAGGRTELLRQRVAAAIDQQQLFHDPGLTIIALASECGTNRTHLSQFFNNDLGLSFRDYINRCRVEYSVQLMTRDTYKAEELALLAGFGSVTTFYCAFAREKGMTPQQWLQNQPVPAARGGEFQEPGTYRYAHDARQEQVIPAQASPEKGENIFTDPD